MRRAWLIGITALLTGLIAGCGQVPAHRLLATNNQDGWVEVTVLTEAGTSRDVRRVIDAAIAGVRRDLHAYHVTVYVVDTEIYIGVVYDVAVAYWDRSLLGGRETVYLREKVVHPGAVPRPGDDELAYYGIVHRLWLNRPDLLLPAERSFYDSYQASHSRDEIETLMLRVQRWLFQ